LKFRYNKDGDVRAPDASFILAERLLRTTEDYAELVPDLMFEVKSKIVTIGEVKKEYPILPLANKQPYAYYADPEEPAIPLEDWDRSNSSEEVL